MTSKPQHGNEAGSKKTSHIVKNHNYILAILSIFVKEVITYDLICKFLVTWPFDMKTRLWVGDVKRITCFNKMLHIHMLEV